MAKTMQIVNGAELISRAAMDAGVNFFAGYPITPASSIYSAMLSKLQERGLLAIGASDEISAISMCIGAAMRGAKSMTATAAPGFALMIENIGYAFATETPLVIVVGQRLGPSTGAATQSAEGDISMVTGIISGGYNIPVIAPSSILNSYETTIRAINISEKYRTPVVLLTEKDIIMSTTNIDPEQIPRVELVSRTYAQLTKNEIYKTYGFNELAGVPDFVIAGSGPHKVTITASFHDKSGNLVKNDPEAFEVAEHLRAKIESNAYEMEYFETDYDSGARLAVISFLATDLAARQAIINARSEGIKIKHLTLHTLVPYPRNAIHEAISGCDTVIIPEENATGQYASMIEHLLEGKKLIRINHVGGLVPPSAIYEALNDNH